MAMGRKDRDRQETMWIASGEIVRGEGQIYYVALNNLFRRHGFDAFVEGLVEKSSIFAHGVGRPSVAPGIYFRMSLVGYFEGLSSERGIAWRCADSMSLREFLGYELTQETPDPSTLFRWRRKLPEKAHREVFEWVVKMAREEGILKGRKVAIDATTLEANAAMKAIVRKADGATYQDYLKKLAKAEGIEHPTPKVLQRTDRKRRGKQVSNGNWKSRTDAHVRMALLKDGRTHMAYKVENAMDIDSRIAVASEIHAADQGGSKTIEKALLSADEIVMNAGVKGGIDDVIADRGYHADAVLEGMETKGYPAYIAEPNRGRRNWKTQKRRDGDDVVTRRQRVFYASRRRSRSLRGRSLQKKRAEYPERGFAHLKRTEGLARVFVRGKREVTKKVRCYVAAANLGVILHALLGNGTPRSLQSRLRKGLSALFALIRYLIARFRRVRHPRIQFVARRAVRVVIRHFFVGQRLRTLKPAYATGCYRLARSSGYAAGLWAVVEKPASKRGPRPQIPDEDLLGEIRQEIESCPFVGDGHRKVHHKRRIVVGRGRILRLMRQNALLVSQRNWRVHGNPAHADTIVTPRSNQMWGADGTNFYTLKDGLCWLFIAIDHASDKVVGHHVAKIGDRFAVREPIKHGVPMNFGRYDGAIAAGLKLRVDWGTQYTSHDFEAETRWLGMEISHPFVGEPQCNGIAERFIRTAKGECLWLFDFAVLEQARREIAAFIDRYNNHWLIERLGYRTPARPHDEPIEEAA